MKKIELSKPVEFDGQKVTEINLNLDALTGEDIAAAETEYLLMGGNPTSNAHSWKFAQHLAARAIRKPVDFVLAMNARDCAQVILEVQGFLLGTGKLTEA